MKFGDLICNSIGIVGRVSYTTSTLVYFQTPGSDEVINDYVGRVKIVSETPALITKNEVYPLTERRQILRNYLTYLRKINNSRLLRDFYHKIFDGDDSYTTRWFWSTLACGSNAPNLISYAPAIESVDNPIRRRGCSVGKFLAGPIVRLGGWELQPLQIIYLSQLLGQTLPNTYNYEFEIVNGTKIIDAYRTGPSSCMSRPCYDEDSPVKWYAINPKTVSLLRIKRGLSYVGRALLWNTDQGTKVLDRIYPSNGGTHIVAAQNWASDQGWDYRTNHAFETAQTASKKMSYTCTMYNGGVGYPFLDSFRFTDHLTYPMVLNLKNGRYMFSTVHGEYEQNAWVEDENHRYLYFCHRCGARRWRCEMVWETNLVCYCASCETERDHWNTELIDRNSTTTTATQEVLT